VPQEGPSGLGFRELVALGGGRSGPMEGHEEAFRVGILMPGVDMEGIHFALYRTKIGNSDPYP